MSILSRKSKIRWMPSIIQETMWQYLQAFGNGYLNGFLNECPDLESLTIYTDPDRPLGMDWMEDCEKKLREMTSAKIVILETGDSCGHQPWMAQTWGPQERSL